jgi:hypothetical protein
MSKLIKKYKESYRNFSRIFKGLFEHAGVQVARRGVKIKIKNAENEISPLRPKPELKQARSIGMAWVMDMDMEQVWVWSMDSYNKGLL